VRVRRLALGALTIENVGVLGTGAGAKLSGALDLFDWYSKKNAVPVIGWIGGNVLKGYRLTIDYPRRVTYWLKQSNPDAHDLDQLGITLRFDGTAYLVAGIATKNQKPTVEGVVPGDTLVRVGELDLAKATWGAIYDSMHGKPGDSRTLLLGRDGKRVSVDAKITAF
jgi:hypothetical protein